LKARDPFLYPEVDGFRIEAVLGKHSEVFFCGAGDPSKTRELCFFRTLVEWHFYNLASRNRSDMMGKFYWELTVERDQQELSLGDTLDVKAGILLALIAVLGTITSTLLADSHLAKWIQVAQVVSLVAAAIGAFCAFWVLVPRDYLLEGLPILHKPWIESVLTRDNIALDQAELELFDGLTTLAEARIAENHNLNVKKSRWLAVAFWPAMVALLIDIISLGAVAVSKFLS
jgi:hypothetical protein